MAAMRRLLRRAMARAATWIAIAVVLGCSAGDDRVDPSDLELRDLLGISPAVASSWDGAQRAAARRVLVAGLRATAEPARAAAEPRGASGGDGASAAGLEQRVAIWLAAIDAARVVDGAGALGVVRVPIASQRAVVIPRTAPITARTVDGSPPPSPVLATQLWVTEQWDAARNRRDLLGPGLSVLAAVAADAGHDAGPVIVVPWPRLAAIAAYIEVAAAPPRLAVNPVLLAALEPDPDDPSAAVATAPSSSLASAPPEYRTPGRAADRSPGPSLAPAAGNPYSFYGSVAECAFAQRTRCEACVPGATCTAVTDASDGNAECAMLDEDSGRGYFLLCINLALAITSVERCTGHAAPACPRDPGAASSLTTLDSNAGFLADPDCAGPLDSCLASIYGAPDEPFPGADGGDPAPADPPRSTTVSCGNACSSNNNNCEASPSCDCSGPSCNNSLSCDSECSSSNDQSGCAGNGDACSGGDGGGGCSSDDGSSSNDCGGSGSGGGGSCGSGGCNNDSCGGSNSCGGSCNDGGSSGGKCSVASSAPSGGPGAALAMSVAWGCLPVPLAVLLRRRARRRGARSSTAPDDSGDAGRAASAAAGEDAP
jgi:uncharacterized membrane protein YgcG